jgi:Ca-activated chloride channel family protein
VESFAIAGDLPLTLGLAIDSSLSLFKKLPDVQEAATRFVRSLDGVQDRAFLVGFGSAPRLVQPTTGDLDRIGRAIDSLAPSGNTAVWEAITLALDQLNQEPGRKALVVFYDGDDEDEQYSFRRTMELARRSLIPVYLIVMNDEAARTQGKGFAVRSRIAKLDELARTGGGRVFYVRTDDDLTPIFDDIAEELRSHYLLTYYPQRPLANPEWRPIQVEVTRSDLTARTISGYGGG